MFANWTRPPFRTHHGDRKGVLRMLSAPCTRTHGRRQDRKRKVENEKRKAAAGCECQHGGGKSGRGRSVRGTLRGASGKLHPTSFSQKPHGPSRGMFGMWGMLGMRGMFPAPFYTGRHWTRRKGWFFAKRYFLSSRRDARRPKYDRPTGTVCYGLQTVLTLVQMAVRLYFSSGFQAFRWKPRPAYGT